MIGNFQERPLAPASWPVARNCRQGFAATGYTDVQPVAVGPGDTEKPRESPDNAKTANHEPAENLYSLKIVTSRFPQV